MTLPKLFAVTLFTTMSHLSYAQELTIAACGDVMIQNVDSGKRLTDSETQNFMLPTKPWFQSAHVGFVNLEGPIGGSEPKTCNSSNCFRFNQDPQTAKILTGVGINTFSLANNHANDMGISGQRSTQEFLSQMGANYSGHFNVPVTSWKVNGLKVSMLAMTANGFAPDFRRPEALDQIKAAKAASDILILSVHMGCEGESCARIKGGPEMYLGENRGDPINFAQNAIDAGADIILGSGPHVPRALDLYKGKLIAYSLGNCATGPGISTAGKAGLAPVLWAKLSNTGHLISWDIASFKNNGRRLTWDTLEHAFYWMMEATKLDRGPQVLQKLLQLREVKDITPTPIR